VLRKGVGPRGRVGARARQHERGRCRVVDSEDGDTQSQRE
jgi:hypothetical protein